MPHRNDVITTVICRACPKAKAMYLLTSNKERWLNIPRKKNPIRFVRLMPLADQSARELVRDISLSQNPHFNMVLQTTELSEILRSVSLDHPEPMER